MTALRKEQDKTPTANYDRGKEPFDKHHQPHGFGDDAEKMRDFKLLTKEAFLQSYSYLSEEEYDLTAKELQKADPVLSAKEQRSDKKRRRTGLER